MAGVTRDEVFAWMRANRATPSMAAAHFGLKATTIRSWVHRHNGPSFDAPPVVLNGTRSIVSHLAPDDRAALVDLVRRLRGHMATIERKLDTELREEATDWRAVREATQAGRDISAQMKTLLDAHPGLMALVEDTAPPDADAAAANIDRLLG